MCFDRGFKNIMYKFFALLVAQMALTSVPADAATRLITFQGIAFEELDELNAFGPAGLAGDHLYSLTFKQVLPAGSGGALTSAVLKVGSQTITWVPTGGSVTRMTGAWGSAFGIEDSNSLVPQIGASTWLGLDIGSIDNFLPSTDPEAIFTYQWNYAQPSNQAFNGFIVFGGLSGEASVLSRMTLETLSVSAAVQEPATWLNLLIGFIAVGYASRRHHPVRT